MDSDLILGIRLKDSNHDFGLGLKDMGLDLTTWN